MWFRMLITLASVGLLLYAAALLGGMLDQQRKDKIRKRSERFCMDDEDYLLVPYKDRLDMEQRHRIYTNPEHTMWEIDWPAIEREVRDRFPEVVGEYERSMSGWNAN